MKKSEKFYDKNGNKLDFGDIVFDGYDNSAFETYYDEIYIAGEKDIWPVENFNLTCYKDGYKLTDFEKNKKGAALNETI